MKLYSYRILSFIFIIVPYPYVAVVYPYGAVVQWIVALTPIQEVGVRFPLGAAIRLASECTFARVNPCHVRGMGTTTLIQECGEIYQTLWCGGDTHRVRLARTHGTPVLIEYRCYTPSVLCVACTGSAESDKRNDFPILRQ